MIIPVPTPSLPLVVKQESPSQVVVLLSSANVPMSMPRPPAVVRMMPVTIIPVLRRSLGAKAS